MVEDLKSRECVVRMLAAALAAALPGSRALGLDVSATKLCVDESESGHFLAFEDVGPGVVRVRIDPEAPDDFPGFAIERGEGDAARLRFEIVGAKRPLEPAVLAGLRTWKPVAVETAAGTVAFTVVTRGRRTVVRLWDPELRVLGGQGKPSRPPELAGPALKSRNPCAAACYAPLGAFCYDFGRVKCHLDSIAGHPHAKLSVIGWTRPCPGEEEAHVPREIFKVVLTDPSVPIEAKTRILLTGRVHGGERLHSFILEGLMDYALGLRVEGSAGILEQVPPPPDDLLEELEIVIYPVLNPDGSADLDHDGHHDFDRYKCSVDMNRRWGTAAEEEEAHEVHVVHQDILREARRKPFRLHRDFHGWGRRNQGGLRHGVGDWRDETGTVAFTVSQAHFDVTTALLQAEAALIPYREVKNYIVNSVRQPPEPGSARFVLHRELAPVGLHTTTSESAWQEENGEVLTSPPYASGDDFRLEGAWLLLSWYWTLSAIGPVPAAFTRGDANVDGSVNISDAALILLHLFGGAAIACEEAADLDQSGRLGIADAVYLLEFNFRGGPRPPPPFPVPAPLPEGGGLGCKN